MRDPTDLDDRSDALDRRDLTRRTPVLVVSPRTVPAVRARLSGQLGRESTDPDDGTTAGSTGDARGPVVVVLLRGPSVCSVDGRLDALVARARGELHLLVAGHGGTTGAARLRWLVPDLAERTVRVLLPASERRDGVRLVLAAGARHPVVVGTGPVTARPGLRR